ncbi:hypothetical protein MC77_012080 [Citrobacter koseri]|nr:hypothetical protein MC77_012080 [Citrobacter koseri]
MSTRKLRISRLRSSSRPDKAVTPPSGENVMPDGATLIRPTVRLLRHCIARDNRPAMLNDRAGGQVPALCGPGSVAAG